MPQKPNPKVTFARRAGDRRCSKKKTIITRREHWLGPNRLKVKTSTQNQCPVVRDLFPLMTIPPSLKKLVYTKNVKPQPRYIMFTF